MKIRCSINLAKIDKDRDVFKGKKGAYLDITIAERKNGADDYGNTHSVYIYRKDEEDVNDRYYFIGSGKVLEFKEDAQQTAEADNDDLPF